MSEPQKIAILGGGMSALATAFELTTPDGWQDDYEITIYQLGWRLGGQAASGRNMSHGARVEEHGPHIWFGFYENAFNMLYRTYAEMEHPPFATTQDAFVPCTTSVMMELVDGEWLPWSFTFPVNPQFPGIPEDPSQPDKVTQYPSLWSYFIELLQVLHDHLTRSAALGHLRETEPTGMLEKPHWWDRVERPGERLASDGYHLELTLLERALRYAKALPTDPAQHTTHDSHILRWLLRAIKNWLCGKFEHVASKGNNARRDMILLDYGLTVTIGFLADGVFVHGLESLNKYEYKDWLRQNGACDFLLDSVIVNVVYDLFYGYEHGRTDSPNIAAGSLMRSLLRMVFTYKGAVMFEMKAGTGDVAVAPVYEVLRARGVKFEFFHKVTDIVPDGEAISEVHIAQQVRIKGGVPYEPLIDVDGLACWPSEPLYDQLVRGEILKAKGVNLESRWADWENADEITLHAGTDYDTLILAIPVAALPDIAPKILASNPAWAQMFDAVQTVQTQSSQIGFNQTLPDMGWDEKSFSMSGYVQPLSSWGDFSQVIPTEDPPPDWNLTTLLYGSGVLSDDFVTLPPPSDHTFPARQQARVVNYTRAFFQNDAEPLFPNVSSEDGEIDWEVIAAPPDAEGEARLASQFYRANVDPTERYVLNTAGSVDARLCTDESGYTNLYITGTWIANGLNMSAIEAAAVSGMQTSRAICGYPQTITGEIKPDCAT